MRGTAMASAVIMWLFVPFAAAQDTRVSGGVSVRATSGDYGSTQSTSIIYAPAIIRVDAGRFEVSAFLPYVSVNNGAGSLSSGGWLPMQGSVAGSPTTGLPMAGMMGGTGMMGGYQAPQPVTTPSAAPAFTSPSGLGDVAASVGYRVVDNILTGVQFVASARVKMPTASSKDGLGTGRPDVGGAATIRKRYDRGWVYGEIGYLVVGQPAGATINNAFTWSAGGGRQIAPRIYLLASAFGNTAVVPGYGAPMEAGAGVGIRLADHLVLTAIPSVGLTHASPQYGVTIGLSTDLWRR